jgi:arylformamidase
MKRLLLSFVLAAVALATHAQQKIADLPYGPDARHRMDVYLPARATGPVLLMVHGGGWRRGDKAMGRVVDAKLQHWVNERGWVLVSMNYRFVPEATVPQQGQDVARAIAAVQQRAASWGADPSRLALMGHSAGAHLAALVSSSPQLAREAGAQPWRATVVLDSAALDTEALMNRRRHLPLYDSAFGGDPAVWNAASPTAALSRGGPVAPMLLVCASERPDDACGQSSAFAARVQAAGGRAEVLPQVLSHGEINSQLGLAGGYTAAVDRFLSQNGL